jgi:hypothetical protein
MCLPLQLTEVASAIAFRHHCRRHSHCCWFHQRGRRFFLVVIIIAIKAAAIVSTITAVIAIAV